MRTSETTSTSKYSLASRLTISRELVSSCLTHLHLPACLPAHAHYTFDIQTGFDAMRYILAAIETLSKILAGGIRGTPDSNQHSDSGALSPEDAAALGEGSIILSYSLKSTLTCALYLFPFHPRIQSSLMSSSSFLSPFSCPLFCNDLRCP
jgi:hypothetical protein